MTLRTHTRPGALRAQGGAAILTAMLIVTLVASLSAAALWQHWRGVEVETAERGRLQSSWLLQGAQDWARLILREDARAGGTDHLGEPWAVALQETRLSTFLDPQQSSADLLEEAQDAFLSGQITDQQARLNVMNLVQNGELHKPSIRTFTRLFDALQLPDSELLALLQNLRMALAPESNAISTSTNAVLLPRTLDQLVWLGLSKPSIDALRPYITLLPEPTPVNLNTAPALVLYASIATLERAQAQSLVNARALSHFKNLNDVSKAIGAENTPLEDSQHSVNSRYFEISGRIRLGTRIVQERSLVQRSGLEVQVLWRDRSVLNTASSLQ
jgi:general secretion pathway protein K